MANILEPTKNTKNLESLRNEHITSRPLKTTSRAMGWAALK